MPIALDMGVINIQNQEVANFIQTKSIDEIKLLFLNFLTKEIKKENIEKDFQKLSHLSFKKIWDNQEDNIYDKFLK